MCFFSWDDLQNGPAPQGMWTRRLRAALFGWATKLKNPQSVANKFACEKYKFLSGIKSGPVTESRFTTSKRNLSRELFQKCR
jgi:hypothetical protein